MGLIEAKTEFLQKILVPEEDIAKYYDVEQIPFARGNFGTVRRATHKITGVKYAAKFLRRRRRATCWAKQINHEIAVLMLSADSEQIVKLHAVYETRNEFALILELAAGGELQAILDEDGSLSEIKSRNCVREVLKALEYLHRRAVAHLDIKPQNILLNTNNLEDGLKLCDFGFSRAVQGNNVCEIQGTADYVAPEVLQYEPLSLNTDIWSVGVLTYVLLTGYSPFGGDSKQETFLNISKCNLTFPEELFEGVSDDAIDFIKSTLRIRPCDRLDVFECLNHKWLQADTTTSSSSSPTSTPVQEILPQILSVQSSNRNAVETLQFESNAFETINSCKTSFTTVKLINNIEKKVDEEDDKENTASIVSVGGEEKDCNVNQQHQQQHLQQHIGIMTTLTTTISPSSTTKLVLEKSSSIHIFPDAPTTPKVSRKTPYDETLSTHVKDIVKKYQVLEQPPSNNNNNNNNNTSSIGDKILMKDKITCCTKYSPLCDNLECVVCHHSESLHLSTTKTTQDIEIDKGIIC
ncbi:unnamed protein product [Diamesa hyperborea]